MLYPWQPCRAPLLIFPPPLLSQPSIFHSLFPSLFSSFYLSAIPILVDLRGTVKFTLLLGLSLVLIVSLLFSSLPFFFYLVAIPMRVDHLGMVKFTLLVVLSLVLTVSLLVASYFRISQSIFKKALLNYQCGYGFVYFVFSDLVYNMQRVVPGP